MIRQSVSDRITVTLSSRVHKALRARAEREGRSTSNLAAFLLESALAMPKESPADHRLGVMPAYPGTPQRSSRQPQGLPLNQHRTGLLWECRRCRPAGKTARTDGRL